MKKDLWKFGLWALIPAVMLLSPVPEGLTSKAWVLSAFYIAAIMGLILRPLPEAAVLFVVLGGYSLFCKGTGIAVSGYASTSCWLVFAAFLVGRAFIETGLGQRIAYVLIGKFGKTSLALGYVGAITDLIISPATPSNTARTGGIVFPIFRAVAVTLGSEPGPTSRRIGAYFALLMHYVSLTTGAMFLTSNATNLLVLNFAKEIYGVEIGWGTFALAIGLPGFFVLLLGPWLVYKLYPPTLTQIDNKTIADEGLKKIGPMSGREKTLIILFVTALVLWSTSTWTKIDSTAVAIAFVSGVLLFRVVSWDILVSEKGAWTTLIWYGGIIGLADGLAKAGYFKWMAAVLRDVISFQGMHPVVVMILLVAFTVPLRYLFASLAAYVSSMAPVILTLAQIGEVPGMLAVLMFCPSTLYLCLLTHFGNACSPVMFGPGYVDQKTWWINGLILGLSAVIGIYILGLPLWKMLGYW